MTDIDWWWSWLITTVGIGGMVLATRKNVWAWPLLLVEESLWVVYAVISVQWGFLVAGLMYGAVYLWGWVSWAKERA